MQELVKRFKVLYKELAGEEFPSDPKVQLMAAVRAVFGSWMNDRAIAYRRMNDIPSSWGTAVNVQMMVFRQHGRRLRHRRRLLPATPPPARTSSMASSS